MKRLVIWGSGGFAREVNHLCEARGDPVAGFLDERPEMKGRIVDDLPILGDIADIDGMQDDVAVVCAGVGAPDLKERFAKKTEAAGFTFAEPLLHPSVRLSHRNTVGPGTVICEGVALTVNIEIGAHVIINLLSTVGHDARIADFATISPGVNVSGNVTIEEGGFIGTGASIREQVRIGTWSVVGGGAFVKDDVPERCTVAGVPATVKKRHS